MAKEITFEQDAKVALKAGVVKLARAVKSTLGPKGRPAILDKGWGAPKITKDGVTVAEEIELSNKAEQCGAAMVKEVASKTNDVAGDGTTTATVLAEAIFLDGLRRVTAGTDAMALNRGLHKATAAVVERLKTLSRPIAGHDEIRMIGTIAGNNQPAIGTMLAEAMEKVGDDGVITIEEGKALETEVEVVEGMQFDRGYLSPQFITDPDTMSVELEQPLILIYEDKIANVQKLLPLLEKVSKANKPLLIVAENIEGDALATLVVNKMHGVLNVAAVKAPGYGDRRKAMLGDLAVLTGARPIMKDLGTALDEVELTDLGTAKRVTITNDTTTLHEGAGDSEAIQTRAAQIRKEYEASDSEYDREKLEERLAKLIGGIAEIRVGAATETELKELKMRFEDALSATRAAIEEGIVPGGGVALVRARAALADVAGLRGDEAQAVDILQKALASPLRQIADNAGVEGAIVERRIVQSDSPSFGWDAMAEEYVDLIERGIIDPTKVVRTALQNAVSVAGLLLTTDAVITTAPERDDDDDEDYDDDDY